MQKVLKKSGGTDYSEVLNSTLLPTAYFAPIYYYAILLQHTNCSFEHHEHFVKQSIRNRCEIYGANGKICLTIPKERKGSSKTKIKDIKIAYKENWQKEHWNAIKSAYNSSPFFEYYQDELITFFKQKETYLVDFNKKLQEVILSFLQKKITYTSTQEYIISGDFTDLREYSFSTTNHQKYNQVFMEKHGFISNLSILDLLFNLGPESSDYLENVDLNI